MERRNRKERKRINAKAGHKNKDLIHEQLKRDEEVLSFLEKREEKMEASMLQKVEGFKYLYKEQFMEFGKLMEKRDKNLEMDNNYR